MWTRSIALSSFSSSRKQVRNLRELDDQTFNNSGIAAYLMSGFQSHSLQHIARNNICPSTTSFSAQHSTIMMKEHTPKTPASGRSIVRNHSPYCESTGPIVQEGFVAARIRALQGFSNQAPIATRSHSPSTPCPPRWLNVYKSRSSPRPSLALKPVLIGTDMPGTGTVKRCHTEILSKDRRKVASASVGSDRSSDVAPSFQLQDQQSSLELTTQSMSHKRGRFARNLAPNLFTCTTPSPYAQRNQDHITAADPSTPYGSLSDVDQVSSVHEENSYPSKKTILSPRAIQPDLVEPWATWNCLPQTEDHSSDYSHEQALKPRGSIAEKLGSMVEQGWVGGEAFGKVNDDEFASRTTDSKSHICDARLDRESESLDVMHILKKMPSYGGSLSVLTTKSLSESQHSTGQDTPPHLKQKELRKFAYCDSRKRMQRQGKRTPAVNTAQRSSSDSGVHYLKTELVPPKGKRRAWTLHQLRRSTSNHSQIQRESSSTIWPSYARIHCSSEQDHESTKSPPSREGSMAKSAFDPKMLRDEQRRQDSTATPKVTGSRRSSSHTKESTRSGPRSTSFFKKFPWYKVALVDKQPVVQDLAKGGLGNDSISRSNRSAQHDPDSNQTELLRGLSKSHTLVECGHEEDENDPKTNHPPNQHPIDQQAVDVITSYYKASSQVSPQLVTTPQGTSEWKILEHTPRAPERPQASQVTTLKITEEPVSRNLHQIVKDVSVPAQSPTRTGPSGTQPRFPSQSGSMDARFESPFSGDILRSPQHQWPVRKGDPRMPSYSPSYANPAMLHGEVRPGQGSSSFGTARPEQESTASPNSSHELRSKVVNLFPKRLDSPADSLSASVHRSDQDESVGRELNGRGKGIKKIQVTVTFDGAEDLVIEATLKNRDQQKRWRTMMA